MRHDPLYTSWFVQCQSPEAAESIQGWLRTHCRPETTLAELMPSTSREQKQVVQPHRIGDYFDDIRIIPEDAPLSVTFRIVFQRKPDAGRYWKDVMARVLQVVQNAAPDTVTKLDYRGDEEPSCVSVKS